MTDGATLSAAGKQLDLALVPATEGNSGYDISKLLKETGNVTLDGGFTNTASCTSAITYIDGDEGILRYRGYPIEQLAEHSSFIETSYLLIYGELPTESELTDFEGRIRQHTMLHEDLKGFFQGFPRDAHPMPVLSSAVSALSTFYQDSLDPFDQQQVEISTIRLLAKLPTIAAYAYKKSIGQPFLYPDNNLTLVENFLRMTFGVPATGYEIDPDLVQGRRPAARAARRPRAELLDLDRASRRLLAGQPLRLGLGRHQRAVRPAPRRREPGRPRDARAHPGRRRRHRRVHDQGQEQGGRRPAHGLRPPGLQELRPARGDHQEDRRTTSSRRPRRRRPAARDRDAASRRSRSPTTTSSSASSTRTSTSTPASSTSRWASRRGCSPCCSPSAGCRAGSPSGAR